MFIANLTVREAIKKYFSHCNQVDCRYLEVGEMIFWLKDHFGKDGCVYNELIDNHKLVAGVEVNPDARWTYLGSIFYFREQEDLILFKLSVM